MNRELHVLFGAGKLDFLLWNDCSRAANASGLMARNAVRATAFFRLPPERVVELGVQIEM